MAFSDYDVFKTNTAFVGLSPINAIGGTSSLQMGSANNQSAANIIAKTTSTKPLALLHGKKSTLIRITLASTSIKRFGIAAIQSARNISSGGAAYLAFIDMKSIIIGKVSNGLSSNILELAKFDLTVVPIQIVKLEFEWNIALSNFGGVQLKVNVTTFPYGSERGSNRFIDIIDKISPLSVTQGEGLFYAMEFVSGGAGGEGLFDQTETYKE